MDEVVVYLSATKLDEGDSGSTSRYASPRSLTQ